jgi:hypothetical protein
MQACESRDLIECQGRVLDQPDGGRLGHQHLRHEFTLLRPDIEASPGAANLKST